MDSFSISVSFCKSIVDQADNVAILVSKTQLMSVLSEVACSRVGLSYSDKYKFVDMNKSPLSMNKTVGENNISKGAHLILTDLDKDYHSSNEYARKYYQRLMWKPLAIVGFFLSICGLIIVITIYAINLSSINSYSVIIDAGSTSSKIYLYCWASNKFVYNADVLQLAKCKTVNGISSYTQNPNQSFTDIKKCLDNDIIPKIPADERSKTSVYLGATAGMRMLSYNNPNATEQIMNFIRDSLKHYTLKVTNPLSDIQIISGDKEGIYGWTTVNYLSGSLPKTIVSTPNLLGALDMGGASAEITFTSMNSTNVLRLYGNSYSLYSHSYLCYGKSQAEYRFLAILIQNSNFSTTVKNPCLVANETMVLDANEIFNVPCVMGKFALEHYGHEVVPPQTWLLNNTNITFIGTIDQDNCQNTINLLFNESLCTHEQCTFNGIYQPYISGQFKAFSAFKLIQEDLNEKNENIGLLEYKKRLKILCNSNTTPSGKFQENQWVKWKCFDLNYMIKILEKFGFNESNWDKLEFIDQVAGSSIGWGLGFMINKTSVIPKEKHFLQIDYTLFVILIVVLVIVLAFAIVFAYLFYTKGRCIRKNNSYLNFYEEENLISTN